MFRQFLRPALVLSVLCSLLASATVVVAESLDDMARRVPVIVRGRVMRSVAGWDAEHRRIWTWTELVVSATVKGDLQGLVLVKQPGGEVDGIGQAVAGVATFREGEECVLFLEPAPDEKGVFRPSGLSAGKIEIVTEQGQTYARRVTEGIQFAAPAGARATPVLPRELLGTPEAFIARVKKALEVKR